MMLVGDYESLGWLHAKLYHISRMRCKSSPPHPPLTTNSPPLFRALAVFPDLQLFVSASHDFTLRVWDAVSMRTVSQLLGHTAVVFAVAVLSSPGLVASGQLVTRGALEGWQLLQRAGGRGRTRCR